MENRFNDPEERKEWARLQASIRRYQRLYLAYRAGQESEDAVKNALFQMGEDALDYRYSYAPDDPDLGAFIRDTWAIIDEMIAQGLIVPTA